MLTSVEVVRRGVGVGEEDAAVAMMLALTQVAEEASNKVRHSPTLKYISISLTY
jgi:hypothetical protein